jgi:outer membrane protein TolC
MKGRAKSAFGLFCLLAFSHTFAAESHGPLTLDEALAAVDAPHPDLQVAFAERDMAQADQRLAEARRDVTVGLEGILRSGKPTLGNDDFTSDNSVRLVARKTLYDFGRTGAAEDAAGAELEARQAALLDVRQRRRLDIMGRFFDVLLADMQQTVDDELMAVAYVSFDQGRDRLDTGQISPVDLAELEARYEEVRGRRSADQQRQRITRALLANAMNRPGQLAPDLEAPTLPGNERRLPEYESLIPVMLANSAVLASQGSLLAASQNRLDALRAERRPTLDAELQAANYSRTAPTRDSVSAGVILNWPLYQGGRVDARIGREQAQFGKLQATTEKLKMDLTQALLETWLEIGHLQRVARQAAKKQTDFRDLVLERSRGEYEVELKTNLGSSMADTVAARLGQRRIDYQLALTFARLEALIGTPLAGLEKQ